MKWLFIIDPIAKLDLNTDTTYAIMKEASSRGIKISVAEINELFFYKNAKVNASGTSFSSKGYSLKGKKISTLDNFDKIFMRKEPPYDMQFHYATQILSFSKRPVVNNPAALRNYNEKLIALNFPELMPPTLVSSNEKDILHFISQNENVVLKSLDSYQGKFIRKAGKDEKNLKSLLKKSVENNLIMVQKFLPNVIKGDKRILMLGGEIIGAVDRIPKKGSYISNFGQGGIGVKTQITKNDRKIAKSVSKFLIENGIHFAGLDVIDGYLTEINITCPTGVVQINSIVNKKLEKQIVDYFLKA